jgi:hypothetical protein
MLLTRAKGRHRVAGRGRPVRAMCSYTSRRSRAAATASSPRVNAWLSTLRTGPRVPKQRPFVGSKGGNRNRHP